MSDTQETLSPVAANATTEALREAPVAAGAAEKSNGKSVQSKYTTDRSNLSIIDPNIKLGSGYSDSERADMMKFYDTAFSALKENTVVNGRIVAITPGEIAIDIGFKSEGMVARSEFSNTPDIAPGDMIEVMIESLEDKEGKLVLSRRKADLIRVWERVSNAAKTGEVMQVKAMRRIKGGIVVDLLGLEAFLPGSQIDVKPVRDFDSYIGQMIDVKVVKVNHPNE